MAFRFHENWFGKVWHQRDIGEGVEKNAVFVWHRLWTAPYFFQTISTFLVIRFFRFLKFFFHGFRTSGGAIVAKADQGPTTRKIRKSVRCFWTVLMILAIIYVQQFGIAICYRLWSEIICYFNALHFYSHIAIRLDAIRHIILSEKLLCSMPQKINFLILSKRILNWWHKKR